MADRIGLHPGGVGEVRSSNPSQMAMGVMKYFLPSPLNAVPPVPPP